MNLLFVCCSCCLWASRLITFVSLGSLCVHLRKKNLPVANSLFSQQFFFLRKKEIVYSSFLFFFHETPLLSHPLSDSAWLFFYCLRLSDLLSFFESVISFYLWGGASGGTGTRWRVNKGYSLERERDLSVFRFVDVCGHMSFSLYGKICIWEQREFGRFAACDNLNLVCCFIHAFCQIGPMWKCKAWEKCTDLMLWVFGIPNLLSFCEVLVEEDRLSLEDCLLRKFMLMRIEVVQGLVWISDLRSRKHWYWKFHCFCLTLRHNSLGLWDSSSVGILGAPCWSSLNWQDYCCSGPVHHHTLLISIEFRKIWIQSVFETSSCSS